MSPSKFKKDYSIDIRIDLEKYFRERPLRNVHIAHIAQYNDYFNLYSEVENEKILGEICNSYLICPSAAEQIKLECPEAKIAMILRNPIERAYSHYLMNVKEAKCINRSFLDELKSDYESTLKGWGITHQYLELGLYNDQVVNFLKHFGKDKVKIILYEDYQKSPKKVLKDLCMFLDIDDTYEFDTSLYMNEKGTPRFKYLNYYLNRLGIIKALKPLFSKKFKRKVFSILFNKRDIPTISSEERRYLLSFYREDIQALSTLIEKDLSSWVSID